MAAGARTERVAEEIRLVVSEILVRQDIKDPRVWDAGIITITHVKVTGDLREARVHFIVHGKGDNALAEIARGLNHASGFVRRRLGERLTMKSIPSVHFVVDRVFDSESKVDQVLADLERERRERPPED